jgi:hypothetical protein
MAVAAAAVVAAPSAAFADEPPGGITWDHVYTATGVKVYVEEYGDIISVCDTSANGHSADADIYADGYFGYGITVSAGAGSCVTRRASDGGLHDLPEGSNIRIAYDGNGGAYSFAYYANDH